MHFFFVKGWRICSKICIDKKKFWVSLWYDAYYTSKCNSKSRPLNIRQYSCCKNALIKNKRGAPLRFWDSDYISPLHFSSDELSLSLAISNVGYLPGQGFLSSAPFHSMSFSQVPPPISLSFSQIPSASHLTALWVGCLLFPLRNSILCPPNLHFTHQFCVVSQFEHV